jgi:hypothetical protein
MAKRKPNPVEWPADKPSRKAVAELVPSARNARTHSPTQVDQIAASITEWGWTVPVLIDEAGVIIAGHGRVLAAEKLRITEIPIITATGWSEARKRAYMLADNKLALNSGWDDQLLRSEIGYLRGLGFDIGLTGFDRLSLDSLGIDGIQVDPQGEWQGMPEFDQKDKTAFRTIPVHFKDQAAVDAFAKLIEQKITDNTRFIWFPEIEIETYADKRYESQS